MGEVINFTGYNRRAVGNCIREGKLKGILYNSRYIIPKTYLIDWLSSEAYNNTNRKSEKHTNMLGDITRERCPCNNYDTYPTFEIPMTPRRNIVIPKVSGSMVSVSKVSNSKLFGSKVSVSKDSKSKVSRPSSIIISSGSL